MFRAVAVCCGVYLLPPFAGLSPSWGQVFFLPLRGMSFHRASSVMVGGRPPQLHTNQEPGPDQPNGAAPLDQVQLHTNQEPGPDQPNGAAPLDQAQLHTNQEPGPDQPNGADTKTPAVGVSAGGTLSRRWLGYPGGPLLACPYVHHGAKVANFRLTTNGQTSNRKGPQN